MAEEELHLEDRYVLKKVKGLANGALRGSGAYGVVRTVSVGGTTCIAKRIHDILHDPRVPPADRESVRRKFLRECRMLSELRHPNIVHFVGVHYDRRGHVSLVMEALDSDLRGFFQRREPDLSVKLGILQDVSFGLLHLHSRHPMPIIHRDLNPGNILLTGNLRAKIADLGVSSYLSVSNVVQTMAPGAWDYMPPEALQEKPHYDASLDVFSFGHVTLCVGIHSVVNIPIPPGCGGVKVSGQSSIKRRKEYLNSLGQKHCLYSVAVDCLHDFPHKRPSSRELCDRLQWLGSAHSAAPTRDGDPASDRRGSGGRRSQIDTTEDTPSDSDIWSSETTFSQDSQEFASFLPSTEHPPEEEDSSAPAEMSRESARTEDETVCLLRQKIAELTAEKEDLQTRVETQEAQAQVYKADFEIERSDRVKAHDVLEDYRFQLKKLQQRFSETEEMHRYERAELHAVKAANARLLEKLKNLTPSSFAHPHSGTPPALPPKSIFGPRVAVCQPPLPVQHLTAEDSLSDKPHHQYEQIPL